MQYWPSSPLQPPEFDMILKIFRTKFWGLQRTTWRLKLHKTSHIMPQNWSEPKVRINLGAWCDWLSEVSRYNQRSGSWVNCFQYCMHILSARDYLWLVLHVQRKVFEIRKWCLSRREVFESERSIWDLKYSSLTHTIPQTPLSDFKHLFL